MTKLTRSGSAKDIRAKLVSRYDTSGSGLDRPAMLSGHDAVTSIYPVPDVLLGDANSACKLGLATADFDREGERIHAAHPTQHSLSLSTSVEFLQQSQQVLYRPVMYIGGRIKLRLAELGKDQAALARESGVALPTINILVHRDSQRSKYTHQIAKALGVTDTWLSTGQGAKLRDVSNVSAGPMLERNLPWSPAAQKLATLFDMLDPAERSSLWPWLVRLIAKSPAVQRAYRDFPVENRRVAAAFGRVGATKREHAD